MPSLWNAGLTPEERKVYHRLHRNRDKVAGDVPPELRGHFTRTLFPSRELRKIVKFTFREEGVQANPCGFLEDCMAARFIVNDFGAKLVLRYGINPDAYLQVLMEGCDLPPRV